MGLILRLSRRVWAIGRQRLQRPRGARSALFATPLLGWPEETPRGSLPALALGLAILLFVGLVPWLGGLVGFLALLLGLGLLAWRLACSVPKPA